MIYLYASSFLIEFTPCAVQSSVVNYRVLPVCSNAVDGYCSFVNNFVIISRADGRYVSVMRCSSSIE